MPRLAAIQTGLIARIAYSVDEQPDRTDHDAALKAEWIAQYGAIATVPDGQRAEIGDVWNGTNGTPPPATVANEAARVAANTKEANARTTGLTHIQELDDIADGISALPPARQFQALAHVLRFVALKMLRLP